MASRERTPRRVPQSDDRSVVLRLRLSRERLLHGIGNGIRVRYPAFCTKESEKGRKTGSDLPPRVVRRYWLVRGDCCAPQHLRTPLPNCHAVFHRLTALAIIYWNLESDVAHLVFR